MNQETIAIKQVLTVRIYIIIIVLYFVIPADKIKWCKWLLSGLTIDFILNKNDLSYLCLEKNLFIITNITSNTGSPNAIIGSKIDNEKLAFKAKNNDEIERVYIRVSRPFDGKDDVYQVRRYMPEHYSAIAKGCINWATMNTHKITYPSL